MRAFLHSGSLSIHLHFSISQNGKQQKHCCTLKQAVYVDLFRPDQLVLLLYIMLDCFWAWCYGLGAITGHQACLCIVSMLNSTITRLRDPPPVIPTTFYVILCWQADVLGQHTSTLTNRSICASH